MNVKYESTITLGNVLQFLGMVLVAVGIYVRIIERLTKVEVRLESLKGDIDRKVELSLARYLRRYGMPHKDLPRE